MMAVLPVFRALSPLFLEGLTAAGIASINPAANGGGIFAPKIVGSFGVGPMAGVMIWGTLMAILCWWFIERRAVSGRQRTDLPSAKRRMNANADEQILMNRIHFHSSRHLESR